MILNDVLMKQNVISQILLKDGDKELPKALKVKIMRIRMAYNKHKQQFDSDLQEFIKELVPEELRDLASKTDLTDSEKIKLNDLSRKVDSEYQEYLKQKGLEEVKISIDDSITIDEYSEILEVNAGNNVTINGSAIKAADFLEIVMSLFVKED